MHLGLINQAMKWGLDVGGNGSDCGWQCRTRLASDALTEAGTLRVRFCLVRLKRHES